MAAIYMWFDGEEQVWTTTLYPVEIIELLEMSASLTGGGMANIAESEYTLDGALLSFEQVEILIDTPIEEDAYTLDGALLSFTLEDLLIDVDGGADEYTLDGALLSFEFENLLVTVDTPDEMLQLACDLNSVDCSMTAV